MKQLEYSSSFGNDHHSQCFDLGFTSFTSFTSS